MEKLTLALAYMFAVALPAAASVQQQEREDDPEARSSQEEREPEVPTLDVTITVSARSLSSTPQVVTVIDRDTIDDSGARTVGELLPLCAGPVRSSERLTRWLDDGSDKGGRSEFYPRAPGRGAAQRQHRPVRWSGQP